MDILDFELNDVVAAGESWAVVDEKPGRKPGTVAVLINGQDINDIYGLKGKLVHTDALWSYSNMLDSLRPGKTEGELKDEYMFSCCISCGEPGCDYIAVVVIDDGEYIRWKTWYRFGDPEDIRYYCFLRTQYIEAIAKLWSILPEVDRKHFLGDRRRTVYDWEV